jgi:hypothetical protein
LNVGLIHALSKGGDFGHSNLVCALGRKFQFHAFCLACRGILSSGGELDFACICLGGVCICSGGAPLLPDVCFGALLFALSHVFRVSFCALWP